MIGYIEGIITEKNPAYVIIDINGLGYEVNITLNTYDVIVNKKECKLFTHLQIREDAWTLYGFATINEKMAFQRLLAISGVGAATARILLSSITAEELSHIVWNGDSKKLEKVKGIGAKTAQRIILELKGKLPDVTTGNINKVEHNTLEIDALNALVGLGIAKPNAAIAIKKAKEDLNEDEVTAEVLIKRALKIL